MCILIWNFVNVWQCHNNKIIKPKYIRQDKSSSYTFCLAYICSLLTSSTLECPAQVRTASPIAVSGAGTTTWTLVSWRVELWVQGRRSDALHLCSHHSCRVWGLLAGLRCCQRCYHLHHRHQPLPLNIRKIDFKPERYLLVLISPPFVSWKNRKHYIQCVNKISCSNHDE